jgi:hypothetical protein
VAAAAAVAAAATAAPPSRPTDHRPTDEELAAASCFCRPRLRQNLVYFLYASVAALVLAAIYAFLDWAERRRLP